MTNAPRFIPVLVTPPVASRPPAAAPLDDVCKTTSGVVAVRGARVLLVDDEEAILRTFRRALRTCTVATASSLAEVMASVHTTEEPFDVAVVDLGLGSESGVDVARWLSEELGAYAPTVVFLSGGSGTPADEAYIAERRVRCLMKPIGIADLRQAISDAMHARDEASMRGVG